MTTYTPRQAVKILDAEHWVQISEAELLQFLKHHGIARKTQYGYELINPKTYQGIIETRTGNHSRHLETGGVICHPHTSLRITETGICWLATVIEQFQQTA